MTIRRRHLAAAFCFGLLAGAAAYGLWVRQVHTPRDPAKRTDRILKKFSARLDLNADQQKKIRVLIGRRHEHIKTVRGQFSAKNKASLEATRKGIKALLSAEQRERFQKMTSEWDARRKRRHAKHGYRRKH